MDWQLQVISMGAPIPKAMMQKLVEAGAVRRVQLSYVGTGWVITATTQAGEEVLRQSEGSGARVFKTVPGALAVVSDLGIRFLDIDLGAQPPQRRSAAQRSLV